MKITIVGGGTAGWIAAYFIENAHPGIHDITLIESSKIGIIGAGEGSTGTMLSLISGHFFNKKIDVDEFIDKTDATNKMGIRHCNWSKIGASYFAPLDVSETGFELNDYLFKYSYLVNGSENMHRISFLGNDYNKKNFQKLGAFHFDGNKVGLFFKEKTNTVKVIDAVVKDFIFNNSGEISCLVLENNEKIESDFFIDCTGFNKKFSNALKTKWISCNEFLPLNTAIPFILKNKKTFVPETKAIAMSSGWMWQIPLQKRIGCGYVFDKNFINEEEAIQEIEKSLKQKIEPIKIINFESGYLEKFWDKNVLYLGLSSSFFEPLEATSINNTIIQVAIFVSQFLNKNKKDTLVKEYQDVYNKRIRFLMQLTTDFISLHYSGGREDTEFWKFIKNDISPTPAAQEILNVAKYGIPGISIFEGMMGSYSIGSANWILGGMGLLQKDYCLKDLTKTKTLMVAQNYLFSMS